MDEYMIKFKYLELLASYDSKVVIISLVSMKNYEKHTRKGLVIAIVMEFK